MTEELDLSGFKPTSTRKLTADDTLAIRRMMAGRRGLRPDGGDSTRTLDGEWMWRTALDFPEAMQLELEALARERGVTKDQIVREALVAYGIGDASHVPGICDGRHSDDEPQPEPDTHPAGGSGVQPACLQQQGSGS